MVRPAPEAERVPERGLIGVRQRTYEFQKFDAGVEFRIERQVSDHDPFLVVVAHLDGNVREKPGHSHETAVADDRHE